MHRLLFLCLTASMSVSEEIKSVVPNIVHQIYDYSTPNFFLYLSLLCVQRYIRPEQHLLWINDEGKYRRSQWENWISKHSLPTQSAWEGDFARLINTKRIQPRLIPFPIHPPGNASTYVSNKAHRSDFVRMSVLREYGGIYLDTDAFPIAPIDSLRIHAFTLAFDNIINPDESAPKRLNNGVILSAPQSKFLSLWSREYASFDPSSWDYSSSIVPYRLATQYPDLIHIEWSRISPISFGFQTSEFAAALTCGIYDPNNKTITTPRWEIAKNSYSFAGVSPSRDLYDKASQKIVLHLTMSAVRGLCFMRKTLRGPNDVKSLPSYLGHVFRVALHPKGTDDFDYGYLSDSAASVIPTAVGLSTQDVASDVALAARRLAAWMQCRAAMGMHTPPNTPSQPSTQWTAVKPSERQQFI